LSPGGRLAAADGYVRMRAGRRQQAMASAIVTSILTLAGVALGAAGTFAGQYLATRESRRAAEALAQAAIRAERKVAAEAFLASCQRVEQAAEGRVLGREQPDPTELTQDMWYRQKCIELVAGKLVRSASFDYANRLMQATYGQVRTDVDVYGFIAEMRLPFLEAAKAELGTLQDDEALEHRGAQRGHTSVRTARKR
jgi:hypothetical protein